MCRIYHKTGEKKNPIFQGRENYLFETVACASSHNTNCLPPLLETQSTLMDCQSQNPMQTFENPFVLTQQQQENDVKSFINHPVISQSQLFPINGLFQSSFSPTISNNSTRTKNNNNPSTSSLSSSILFKSLLSHQDYNSTSSTEEEATIRRQCKTKVNFSHFQIPYDSSFQSMEKNQSNPFQYQNPLLPFDQMMMDYSGVFGLSAATVCSASSDATVNDMSTSIAFNGSGYQMMLDPPSKLPGP